MLRVSRQRTSEGRLFQIVGAAEQKPRAPNKMLQRVTDRRIQKFWFDPRGWTELEEMKKECEWFLHDGFQFNWTVAIRMVCLGDSYCIEEIHQSSFIEIR